MGGWTYMICGDMLVCGDGLESGDWEEVGDLTCCKELGVWCV